MDRSATLRVGIDYPPTSWDPIKVQGNAGAYNLSQVYDQLLQLNASLRPAPMLATSWSFSQGGRTLTLKLRDDATFNGDGAKVDATAVRLSLEHAKTAPGSLVASELSDMSSVTAVNPTTVRIGFSKPAYSFPALLASDPRVSSVVDPKYLNSPGLGQHPHGSGPYTLTSATQSQIVMTRVAHYWGKTAGAAKTIKLMAIPDENTRFNALQAGQIDLTFVNTDQYSAAASLAKSGRFQTYYGPKAQKYVILVDPKRHAVSSPLVRKAISLAVNRQAFCSSQFQGMSTPSQQLFVRSDDGYDASLDTSSQLTPQIATAKRLLAQAGERHPTITLLTLGAATSRGEIIQQQLAAAGITVKITSVATLAALLTGWASGNYDMSFSGALGTADSSLVIDQNITAAEGFGLPSYLTTAVQAANQATPGTARQKAFQAVNQILISKPVDVPLCDVGLGLVGSSKVTGMSNVKFIAMQPPFETRLVGLSR